MTEEEYKKPRFCPKCHRQVLLPEMLQKANITVGNIKINCGNNNCKGQIVIKTNETSTNTNKV